MLFLSDLFIIDNPKPFTGARSDQLVIIFMEKVMMTTMMTMMAMMTTMMMITAETRGPLVAGQLIAMHCCGHERRVPCSLQRCNRGTAMIV